MKLKIFVYTTIVALIIGIYGLYSIEAVQKKVFDVKADLVGSDRTVTFYTQINAQPVASFTDKDVRFEETNNGISVWLGSQKRKIHSNMSYIIKDN